MIDRLMHYKTRSAFIVAAILGIAGSTTAAAATASAQDLAHDRPVGQLTPDFLFYNQMPTGLTVTSNGRQFVSYPRWGDGVKFTVAELRGGKEVPYPNLAFNTPNLKHPGRSLVSVQSVVAPGDGHLWLLDTGTLPAHGYDKSGQLAGGPKLVAVDLATNRVDRTIVLPPSAALNSSYLNDVRFDFNHGKAGIAYISDSSFTGPGAIIVVDLASGNAWRKLDGAPSTQAEPGFRPIVEGRYMMMDDGTKPPSVPAIPVDGIALSADGSTLYYSALCGRHLYSVPTKWLRDREASPQTVQNGVTDLGEKGASDGLLMGKNGRLYATDYEHNAIHVLNTADGHWSTLAHDPRLLWPDTMSLGPNGDLYVTANQLQRQPQYRGGHDDRNKPYAVFRIRTSEDSNSGKH
ncbi:MAG: L-dopachrome tautomerase-related protein [Salinisphaera sp.]|nr:L-dopachrome tautomerase-related protein [Salinisphaera sp.]